MGLNLSDPCVLYKYLCHLLDVATTFYLELFQITVLLGAILKVAPLYVSGISTQSYPDRC